MSDQASHHPTLGLGQKLTLASVGLFAITITANAVFMQSQQRTALNSARNAASEMTAGYDTGKEVLSTRANVVPQDHAALASLLEEDLALMGSGKSATADQAMTPAQVPAAIEQDYPAPPPEVIVSVQRGLALLGYYAGGVDGQMGPVTLTAVRNFQRDRNLPDNGFIDQKLVDLLEHRVKIERAAGITSSGPLLPNRQVALSTGLSQWPKTRQQN